MKKRLFFKKVLRFFDSLWRVAAFIVVTILWAISMVFVMGLMAVIDKDGE